MFVNFRLGASLMGFVFLCEFLVLFFPLSDLLTGVLFLAGATRGIVFDFRAVGQLVLKLLDVLVKSCDGFT